MPVAAGSGYPGMTADRRWKAAAIGVFMATTAQLVVATFFATQLAQFEGKGFGARLVAYPLMMLLVPGGWILWRRRQVSATAPPPTQTPRSMPWAGFTLIMAPFLVDVTGNSANLYDSVAWWDDANHFVNWLLLCGGIGILLLRAHIRPAWALGLLVAGVGALLAIGWELGEWYTFIRHGTELDTAYTDTLGDEALGSLGAAIAGLLVASHARRSERSMLAGTLPFGQKSKGVPADPPPGDQRSK